MKFTNTTGIPPLLAGWLSIDEYDYSSDSKTISTTTLMKPIRQMVLSKRYRALPTAQIDVSTLVASSVGTAVHDSIERIWKSHLPTILTNLNVPNSLHDKYVINPEKVTKGMRPVYLELRTHRKVGDWTVSGKFDAILDGQVNDFKYTSTYSYQSESKGEDYAIQGSVYRWLNPDKVSNDYIKINFIFGNFDKKEMYRTGYPPAAAAAKEYQLYEAEDTEQWLIERIAEIGKYIDAPEKDLPPCTPDDLWMDPPTYKYYKNPDNRKRSTANCDTFDEALSKKVADGNVGVIVEVQSEPKACLHCEGAPLCKQKDTYIAQGILKL